MAGPKRLQFWGTLYARPHGMKATKFGTVTKFLEVNFYMVHHAHKLGVDPRVTIIFWTHCVRSCHFSTSDQIQHYNLQPIQRSHVLRSTAPPQL